MDKRKRNIAAIGALTLVAAVVFLWGFYYLLGNPVFQGGMDVTVLMTDGAGLKRGDRVHLQGVEVGSVKMVRLVPGGGVVAELRLSENLPLPADTRASVSGDVFGAHTVDLRPGSAMVKLEDGDTIRGFAERALTAVAGDIGSQATQLLTRFDSLLSPETVGNLGATAAVLPGSAHELRATFIQLHQASAALRRTALEVENARTGEALASAIARADESARALTALANSLERSIVPLASVFEKIDRGHGTLGRLVNDSSLYHEMNGAASEFRSLAADIKRDPRRYIKLEIF